MLTPNPKKVPQLLLAGILAACLLRLKETWFVLFLAGYFLITVAATFAAAASLSTIAYYFMLPHSYSKGSKFENDDFLFKLTLGSSFLSSFLLTLMAVIQKAATWNEGIQKFIAVYPEVFRILLLYWAFSYIMLTVAQAIRGEIPYKKQSF